jgi:hypothetical protein
MALQDLAYFDPMQIIQAFEMGAKRANELKRENALQGIGQIAAGGDYKGAAAQAYGAGEFDAGQGLAKIAQGEFDASQAQRAAQLLGDYLAKGGNDPATLGQIAQVDPKMAAGLYGDEQQQGNVDRSFEQSQTNADRNYELQLQEAQQKTTGPKAPSGYRQTETGDLEPIPGGPADPTIKNAKNARLSPMPAELAARIGLAKDFGRQYPNLVKEIEGGIFGEPELTAGAENLGKRRDMMLRRGKQGEILREIKGGSEALTRMLTGAGMNMAEATNEVQQYLPEATDTSATILQKMSMLQRRLDSMVTEASAGRVSAGQPQAQPEQQESEYNLGTQFDDAAQIPEGAIVVDDETGQAMQKINGELVPVQ